MKKTDNKLAITVGGLSALCVAVLAGVYFLTKEPEMDFAPTSTPAPTTEAVTWKENTSDSYVATTTVKEEENQVPGEITDTTQTIISEGEDGTVTDLSGSTTKEDAEVTKPSAPPHTDDDTTNPDKTPEYVDPIYPTPTPAPSKPDTNPPAPTPEPTNKKPGQVYDPVFGWVTTGDTIQDSVDNDGDINKQLGTMGN